MQDMNDLFRLDGKVVMVTGAGRGIGRAVCELFAAAGARIAACDIDGTSVEKVTAGIPGSLAIACDISIEGEVVKAVDAVLAGAGRLEILVHAAAVFPKYEFTKLSAAQWDAVHSVNTRGTFLVMREAIRAMQAQGNGGAIVNISSASGERAVVFNNSAYGASKAAMTNLTRSVAAEVAADGIRINAVLPGGVATEGAKEATQEMADRGLANRGPIMTPGRLPMQRAGQPSEIAAACLFLASPAASYITGQALAVDGGFLVS